MLLQSCPEVQKGRAFHLGFWISAYPAPQFSGVLKASRQILLRIENRESLNRAVPEAARGAAEARTRLVSALPCSLMH